MPATHSTMPGLVRWFADQLARDCQCETCLNPMSLLDLAGFICNDCLPDLPRVQNPCVQCGEPLPTSESRRCHRCQQQPPDYDYSYSNFALASPLSHWLLNFKDHKQLHWGLRLAQLMQLEPPAMLSQVDALVCIPSHWSRQLKRGFNPSELLARELAGHFQLPLLDKRLRKRRSADLRELSAEQRLQVIEDSLWATAPKDGFNARHVLIIDDVMTTGATASVAARLLKQQGIETAGVWTLARTLPAS